MQQPFLEMQSRQLGSAGRQPAVGKAAAQATMQVPTQLPRQSQQPQEQCLATDMPLARAPGSISPTPGPAVQPVSADLGYLPYEPPKDLNHAWRQLMYAHVGVLMEALCDKQMPCDKMMLESA